METEDDLKEEVISEEVLDLEIPKVNPLAKLGESRRKDYSSQFYEKDVETSEAVVRLAKIGLNKGVVAAAAKLTIQELNRYYLEEYTAGQAQMQQVVASGLMEQAKAGNPQVLMYLGKSKLGWSENNVFEHIGTINAVVSAKPLSKEEFAARYLEAPDDKEEV